MNSGKNIFHSSDASLIDVQRLDFAMSQHGRENNNTQQWGNKNTQTMYHNMDFIFVMQGMKRAHLTYKIEITIDEIMVVRE